MAVLTRLARRIVLRMAEIAQRPCFVTPSTLLLERLIANRGVDSSTGIVKQRESTNGSVIVPVVLVNSAPAPTAVFWCRHCLKQRPRTNTSVKAGIALAQE